MPEGAGPDQGATAEPGEKVADPSPHADIVERLLEYQRRLREESDEMAPTIEGDRGAPHAPTQGPAGSEPRTESKAPPEPAEPTAETEREPEARPEPETQPGPTPEADPGSPDARQLQDRIQRLDETLARISAMLPLLRGGDDRERES